MNIVINLLFIVIGFIVLIKAANYFVDSAIKIAEISNIPKLIIGATIVSLATTLPELFVSTNATIAGKNDMAIGNALGSVIFNTGVILSLAAIFMAGKVDRKNVFEKAILLLISLVAFTYFASDYVVIWYEGAFLFLLVLVYVYLNLRAVKKQNESMIMNEVKDDNRKLLLVHAMILIFGAVGIFIGSRILVNNATDIAETLGLSEQVIGLTILAIGTSLPELTTTLTAIVKKQQSLSVGNVLGANILNMTMIMGLCSLISRNGLKIDFETLWPFQRDIPQTLAIDLPIGFLIILLFVIPIIITGQLKKWQGIVGIIIYLTYLSYLLINI